MPNSGVFRLEFSSTHFKIGRNHKRRDELLKRLPSQTDFLPNAQDEHVHYLVQHNLSLSSLMFAKEIDGLACPSMALVRDDNPLLDFGEISLIASPSLVNPSSDCAIYSGDAFVKRSPEPWGKINREAGLAVAGRAAQYLQKAGLPDWDGFDTSLFYRKERLVNARDRITSVLRKSLGLSLEFLSRQGINPLVPTRDDPLRDIVLEKARALNGGRDFLANNTDLLSLALKDDALLAEVTRLIDEAVNEGRETPILDRQTLDLTSRDTIKKAVLTGSKVPLYDKKATARAIDDLFFHNQTLEKQWAFEVAQMVRSIVPFEEIKRGRQFVPLNLANLVKHLKSSAVGSEASSSVSVGRLKSCSIRRLSSTAQLAGAMNQIGDANTIAAEDKTIENLTRKFVAKMFHHGLGSNGSDEHYAPLGIFLPYISRSWQDAPSDASIKASFDKYGLVFSGNQTAELEEMIGLFREVVREVAESRVPYFEAKVQRAVDLSEFRAAVVPATLPADMLAYLESKVGQVITYAPGDHEKRREALSNVARAPQETPSFVPRVKGFSF